MCIDIVGIRSGIANVQISLVFDRGVCPPQDRDGVLSSHVFCLFVFFFFFVFFCFGFFFCFFLVVVVLLLLYYYLQHFPDK